MSMGIIQQDGTYKKVAGNFAPERVATDPITSLTAGRLIYNTTQNIYKYYNGTEWVAITQSEDEIEHVATNPASPDNGTVIYNTTDDMLRFYNGSSWVDCEATEPQIASSLLKDTSETGFAPYNYIQLKNNNSAAKDDDGFVTMSMLYSILSNFGFSIGTNVPGFLSISEDNTITKTNVNNSIADGANGYSFPVADGDDPTGVGRIIADIQGTLSNNNYDAYDIPNTESIMKYAPKKVAVTPSPNTLTSVMTRFYTDYITTDNVESTFNEFDQNMNLINFVKFLHDHSGEFILLYFDNSNLGFTGDDTVSSYTVVYNVAQNAINSDTSFKHRFMIPFGNASSANQDGYGFGTLFIEVEYSMNTDGTVGNSISIDYVFSINAVRPTSGTLPTTRNYGVHCSRNITRDTNMVYYTGYTNGGYGDEFQLRPDMSDLSGFVDAVNTGLYTNDDYYNLCVEAIALN